MKKLLLITLFVLVIVIPCLGAFTTSIDNKSTYKHAYVLTGKPKDLFYDWCQEVEDKIDGTLASNTYLYLTPTTAPTSPSEGYIYYDDAGDVVKFRNGSAAWITLASSSSGTLDEAYDSGTGITVDNGAVTLTATNAADNVVMSLIQQDTAASTALLITGSQATANAIAIDIDGQTTGRDIEGTGASFIVTGAGAVSCVGITNTAGDILFDDTYDVSWDTSRDTLLFEDNSILGLGGEHDAAPDFAVSHDGTDVDVEAAADGAIWKWGNGTNDIDMWWYGSAAGDYFWWDESGAELLFVDAHIGLADDGTLTFGTDDDFVISSASDGVLLIEPDAQGNSINLGSANTASMSVTWYTDTNGDTILFDEENVLVDITDVDVSFDDDAVLFFGASVDVEVQYDGTKNQLEIREPDAGGPAILQIVGGEGQEGRLIIAADNDDEATDQWQLDVDTSGTLSFGNDTVADTFSDHLTIAAGTGNVTLTGDIVNEGGDTIVMSTDDSYIFTSDDEAVTVQIQGNANAKSAILDLSADAANDNADTWTHTVADGGAYTIANEGTATMTISEAMDITGTITLADDELLSNASDVVDITGDDAATTFAIRGATGNFSAVLEVSADDASDDADTWLLTVADGGAATLANDGTATLTINESVTMGASTVFTPIGINQAVVVVPDGAAYDVTAANTGKTHVIPGQAADITMDLPTEAAGLYYKFVYVGGAEDAQDWTIDSENNTNYFIGGLMTIDDDDHSTLVVYSDGSDDSIVKIDTPNAGTIIEIWCNGTQWYISGTVVSGTDTAVVFSNL